MHNYKYTLFVHFPQVRALCPGALHLLHTRILFDGGSLSDIVAIVTDEGNDTVVVVALVAVVMAEEGLGHTISHTSSGQYSEMWLYRYDCRTKERPDGGSTEGS